MTIQHNLLADNFRKAIELLFELAKVKGYLLGVGHLFGYINCFVYL